jgi:predicted AAA+ superfamily ATPase
MMDLSTVGFLFESLVTRDLRVYSSPIRGEVYHYRDSNDLEIDNIIVLRDGRWAAIEIKLGSFEIEKAAINLLKLKEITKDDNKEPSFLAVVYGGEYSYIRPDGVYVISIGNLKD